MPKVEVPKEAFLILRKWKWANGLKWREIFENLAANVFKIEDSLKSYDSGTVVNVNTFQTFYDEWIKNYVANIERMKTSLSYMNYSVDPEFERKKPNPALVLGSGPSLEGKWDLIRKFKGKIFCPDRTAMELFEHDILPDYITNIDSQDLCAEYLDTIDQKWLDKTTGIVLTTANPKVVDKFKKIIFINPMLDEPSIANPPSITRVFLEMSRYTGVQIPAYDLIGNVSMASWQHAQIWGYNPVILLGVDLGFKSHDGVIKLHDSPDWERLEKKIKEGKTTEQQALAGYGESDNPFGNHVWHDFIKGEYIKTATWIINYYKDVDTIQCGEHASLYKGINCMWFKDYIENQDNLSKLKYLKVKKK